MTFEVKLHVMKKLCLYYVSNHTKFQEDQNLNKMIYNRNWILNIKITFCDLQYLCARKKKAKISESHSFCEM